MSGCCSLCCTYRSFPSINRFSACAGDNVGCCGSDASPGNARQAARTAKSDRRRRIMTAPILLSDARVGFQDYFVTKIALLLALPLLLPAQDFSELRVERIAANYRFTEGPAWSGQFLLFSDIPSNRILKFTPPQGPAAVFRENSGGANGNAFDSRGRLYTCEGANRRVTRTSPDGKIEVLAERFEGKRLNAPNDITVRRDNHVYFTDPAYGAQEDSRELPFYGVFHLSPRGDR
ncbi:MAG TPA: hypothetical protein DCY80_03665, partial [Solibacterales bacterium]|nr:hypothetical protein [Bryobacterales bacterium]